MPSAIAYTEVAKAWKDPSYIVEEKHTGSRVFISFTTKGIEFIREDEVHEDPMIYPELIGCVFDAVEKEDGGRVIVDVVRYKGQDTTSLPWVGRRKIIQTLTNLLPPRFTVSPFTSKNKEGFYLKIVSSGGDGAVLKKAESTYQSGISDDWISVPRRPIVEVVCYGFGEPSKTYRGVKRDEWPYWETEDGEKIKTDGGAPEGVKATPVTKAYFYSLIDSMKLGRVKYLGKKEDLPDVVIPTEWVWGVTEKGYVYGIEPAGTCRLMSDEVQKMASYRREDYLLKVMEVEGRLTKNGQVYHARFVRLKPERTLDDILEEGDFI